MAAEGTQEQGREAALATKRWLESTTFINLHWNAYSNSAMCTVECLGGKSKVFDLAGQIFLEGKATAIVVENKGVKAAHDQLSEYRTFLAIAYSSTALSLSKGRTLPRVFFWVTTFPFGTLKTWSALETADTIRSALADNPDLLDGQGIDEELIRDVASRVWLLVFNSKQQRLSLSSAELGKVRAVLMREGDGL